MILETNVHAGYPVHGTETIFSDHPGCQITLQRDRLLRREIPGMSQIGIHVSKQLESIGEGPVRIGIDLGGTKIEAVALDDHGRQLWRARVATPRDDYGATVSVVSKLVKRVEGDLGRRGSVGVGGPGAVSRASGLMKNCNSVWLNGRPLKRDLECVLGRSVRIANDANCFALSEAVSGAAKGASHVFGVILGTGTGGGLVMNGRAVTGQNSIAGEWGHNSLPWPQSAELPGPACYCGLHGCIETWLSGPGFAADHARTTGEALDGRSIVRQAELGETAALATLERYVDRLARGLASIINTMDPDVIVLGGGLSAVQHLYVRVPEIWGRWVFSDRIDTRLLPPVHGDSSGVLGAACLWSPTESGSDA